MKRILLCDDEQDIRDILEMLIEIEYDVEFGHAEDGEEGIQLLSNESLNFDLIICDMNMPKKKGDEVFNFNKVNNNIPFILLSGDADADVKKIQSFYEANQLNSILPKPWTESELYKRLDLVLKD